LFLETERPPTGKAEYKKSGLFLCSMETEAEKKTRHESGASQQYREYREKLNGKDSEQS